MLDYETSRHSMCGSYKFITFFRKILIQ